MKVVRVALFAIAVIVAGGVSYLLLINRAFHLASKAMDEAGYGEHVLLHSSVSHCASGDMTITFVSQGGRVPGDPAPGFESHGFVCVGLFGGTEVHRVNLPANELPDWEPADR